MWGRMVHWLKEEQLDRQYCIYLSINTLISCIRKFARRSVIRRDALAAACRDTSPPGRGRSPDSGEETEKVNTGKTSRARSLRRRATEAESKLWYYLRSRQLGGWKFRRQFPVDRFTADFACIDAKLIVELDGSQHAENAVADAETTIILNSCGFKVVRYWNADVLRNTSNVLEDILAHLEKRK